MLIPVLPIAGQKYPTIFRYIFGIFRDISKFLFIYSAISRGTPNDVLRTLLVGKHLATS
jgi:hypothetical protein